MTGNAPLRSSAPRLSSLMAVTARGALLIALLAAAPARAQEPGAREGGAPVEEQAWLRVIPVKATGTLRDGDRPAIPPALEPFGPLLAPLAYDRYTPVAPAPAPVSGPPGVPLQVELPLRYRATLRWEAGEAGRLVLSVTVTRPKPPEGEPAGGTDAGKPKPEGTKPDGNTPDGKTPDGTTPDGNRALDERLKVVEVTVRTLPSGHVLINCKGAYPDGDLLLLVTVQLEPFLEPRQGS